VDLQQMIDSVRATVAMARSQGVTQARIALQPQELGEIRIHLSQTADGLLARVTADTPAGAQALVGGRAELHHSLSSLGVSLLRLDIGSSGSFEAGDGRGRFNGDSNSSRTSTNSSLSEETEGLEADGELGGARSPMGSHNGELVDVLA